MMLSDNPAADRDEAFRRAVEEAARGFAVEAYLREHPGDRAGAREFAGRCWRQFVETALDFLALTVGMDEAEAAAPWN